MDGGEASKKTALGRQRIRRGIRRKRTNQTGYVLAAVTIIIMVNKV